MSLRAETESITVQSYDRRRAGIASFFLSYALGLTADQTLIMLLSAQALVDESALAASLLVMCCSVPRAVLLLPAGILTDRFGVKRCLLASGTARLVSTLIFLVPFAFTRAPGINWFALGAILFGCAEAIYLVGSQSWIASYPNEANLSQAQSAFAMTQRICSIAAPLIFGVLAAQGTEVLLCGLSALSFISLLGVAVIPNSGCLQAESKPQDFRMQIKQATSAIQSLVKSRRTRATLTFVLVAESITAALFGVGYATACGDKGWDVQTLSALLMAYGAGSAVGSFAGTKLPFSIGTSKLSVCAAALLFAFCFIESLPLAICSSVMCGVLIGIVSVRLMVAFLEEIYSMANKSALVSTLSLASFGAAALSPLVFGLAADRLGTPTAFAFFCAALVLTALIYERGRSTSRQIPSS